jgi:Probable zinc-ribbon domain
MKSNPLPSKPQFKQMVITCIDCHADFAIPVSEQLFFYRKNLSIPRRCPECRQRRRNSEVK